MPTSDPVDGLALQAGLLSDAGRYVDALELLDDALLLEPTHMDIQLARVRVLRLLERPDAALDAANRILSADPTIGRAHAEAAHALLATGSANLAVTAADTAVRVDPDDAFGWLQLVRAHHTTHNSTAAGEAAAEMAARFHDNPLTPIAVALAALAQRPTWPSVPFTIMLMITPLGIPYLTWWSLRSLASRQRLRHAETVLRRSLAANPDDAPARTLLADVVGALGHRKQGIEHRAAAGRQAPKLVRAPSLLHTLTIGLARLAVVGWIGWLAMIATTTRYLALNHTLPAPAVVAVQLAATVALAVIVSHPVRSYLNPIPTPLQPAAHLRVAAITASLGLATGVTGLFAIDTEPPTPAIVAATATATALGLVTIAAIIATRNRQPNR